MIRPYYLSLITVYGTLLPITTYVLTNFTSNPENYKYAYWGSIICTLSLPIICPMIIIHLGLCMTFYIKERDEPENSHHIYFILGVIPIITIITLILSIIWQIILKLELTLECRTGGNGINMEGRLMIMYYLGYILATIGASLFLRAFIGAVDLGIILLIVIINSVILYPLVLFLIHIIFSQALLRYKRVAQELLVFVITYLFASVICFILYFCDINISDNIKVLISIIGIGGVSCLIGLILFYFIFLYIIAFSRPACARHTIQYFIFYIFFGVYINYGFTKAADPTLSIDYGYYLIFPILIIHIMPTCCVIFGIDNIHNRHYNDPTKCFFFGFIPVLSVFLFSAFWIYTEGYKQRDGGLYPHILYIFGVQFFSCFLGNILSQWHFLILGFIRSINLNMRMNMSKLYSVILAIVYLFVSCVIQCSITIYLGLEEYLFGLVMGPIISLLYVYSFIYESNSLYDGPQSAWLRGVEYISNLFLEYYISFCLIFSCFFIDFCVKQIYNPTEIFYLEYIFGILFWIPTFIGTFIFLSIKVPIIKLILCIISILSVAFPISYIFTQSSYDQTSNKLTLLIAGLFCFLPMLIYFLLCTFIPSRNRTKFCLEEIFVGCCRDIRNLCNLRKCFAYILIILLILWGLLTHLISVICLLFYSYIFQTFKLCLLTELSDAHIPYPWILHEHRRYINLNLAIFLEGITLSLPIMILFSIYKWCYMLTESENTITLFWLSISVGFISVLHSVINTGYNLYTNKHRLFGFTEMPFVLKLFIRRHYDLEVNNAENGNLVNGILNDIPKIDHLARMPPAIKIEIDSEGSVEEIEESYKEIAISIGTQ